LERKLRALAEFSRTALDLERSTVAGKLNALGMAIGFVVLTAGEIVNGVQVVVRVFDPNYSSGVPSTIALFAIFCGYSLLCVLMLGLLDPGSERP
jgi:hypothetical protein